MIRHGLFTHPLDLSITMGRRRNPGHEEIEGLTLTDLEERLAQKVEPRLVGGHPQTVGQQRGRTGIGFRIVFYFFLNEIFSLVSLSFPSHPAPSSWCGRGGSRRLFRASFFRCSSSVQFPESQRERERERGGGGGGGVEGHQIGFVVPASGTIRSKPSSDSVAPSIRSARAFLSRRGELPRRFRKWWPLRLVFSTRLDSTRGFSFSFRSLRIAPGCQFVLRPPPKPV